jgi:membrane dipeptidase
MENNVNRRDFIQKMGLVLAAVPQLNFTDLSGYDQKDYLTFDFHAHPGLFFAKGSNIYPGEGMLTKTLSDMKAGHLTGAFFSLVADAKVIEIGPTGVKPSRSYEPNEAWAEYNRQIKLLKEIIAANDLKLATKVSDLDSAMKDKKTAAFISVEGGDFLEGQAGHLDQMYADGVRSIQLVHYHTNELGDLQTEPAMHNGLSTAGKEVIRKMNKLKMLIDLAHATEATTKAVCDITDAPIIISHSILQTSDNRPMAKRALTVEHAKMVAKIGGVIGAWPSGFNTSFDDFLTNTMRLIDAVGVDHVGLGTDMDGNFKPVFSSYTQVPDWIEGLKSKGLKDEEVRKIVGGNARRVLAKVL